MRRRRRRRWRSPQARPRCASPRRRVRRRAARRPRSWWPARDEAAPRGRARGRTRGADSITALPSARRSRDASTGCPYGPATSVTIHVSSRSRDDVEQALAPVGHRHDHELVVRPRGPQPSAMAAAASSAVSVPRNPSGAMTTSRAAPARDRAALRRPASLVVSERPRRPRRGELPSTATAGTLAGSSGHGAQNPREASP